MNFCRIVFENKFKMTSRSLIVLIKNFIYTILYTSSSSNV